MLPLLPLLLLLPSLPFALSLPPKPSLPPTPSLDLDKRTVSYVTVTSVTFTGSAPPPPTGMPTLAPSPGSPQGLPPNGQIYRLNSSFVITDVPATRTYDWTIAARTGAPDGYVRNMITINGQMPGPLIEANEGDTLVINVQNQLNDTTSIHWHGMQQNSTPFYDGVPGMTQCPIPANGSFTYEFNLTQYGTYWYHSHSAVEYTDGLQGPLIIHSVDDPLVRGSDFDVEEVLMLFDWYHDEASTIVEELLSLDGYHNTSAAPSPQSGLINGQGIYNCSATTSNCTTQTPPIFNIDVDQKYRMRLINSGSHAQFYFSVDNHTLNVTEADGTPVTGATAVHRVPIHNGERYSVIIDTSNDTAGTAFWIRSTMNTDCFNWIDATLNATAVGVLEIGTAGTNATSTDWSDALPDDCVDLDDSLLVPIVTKAAPTTVNQRIAFDSAFGTITYSSTNETYDRFFVNDTTYTNYIYQPLLQTVAAGGTANATDVTTATFDDDVEVGDIIINNLDPTLDHPYHLHGYEFQIVARGSGSLAEDDAGSIDYNTTNPLRRDTLVIPADSYAVLRFTNDLPGVWVLHCHIAWHLAEGFLAAIITRPTAIAALSFPSSVTDLCSERPSDVSVDTTEPGKRSLLPRGLAPYRNLLAGVAPASVRTRGGARLGAGY